MNKLKRYIGYDDFNEFIKVILDYKEAIKINKSNIFIDKGFLNVLDADLAYKIKDIISSNLEVNESKLKSILLENSISDQKSVCINKLILMYLKNHKNVSVDILSNFIARIISLTKEYCKVNEKYSVLYIGDIKKNEVYFLILLSLFGNEVIYMTASNEDKFLIINEINEYSTCINGKNFKSVTNEELSKFIKEKCSGVRNIEDSIKNNSDVTIGNARTSGRLNLNRDRGKINLNRNQKNGQDISNYTTEDITSFINDLKNNNIDKLYNGFIGSNLSEEDYKNSLCKLEEQLKNKFKFMNITKSIMPAGNDEVQNINKLIDSASDKLESYKKIFLQEFKDNIPYKNIIQEFSIKNPQKPKIENFSLKILIWAIRIKEFILADEGKKAVLYFGDIKTHEVYFFKLLKDLNVNIIYIYDNKQFNSDLMSIGKINTCVGNNFFDIKEYPKEVIKEVETSAYRASQQVDKILYNSETGMYRPYQLNEKTMKSIILKTTLDEIFILWNEPSSYRTGFIDETNNVEIPVLFLKLNGVYEDRNRYWKMVSKLYNNENVVLIKNTDFYKSNYNNQEFYSGNYLFNDEGFIDEKKLKESKFYKFNYLDKNLQGHIIQKINEIIHSKFLLFYDENNFRIRVLMTILDMDEKFIKLLQAYNIGGKLPKLILYNNNNAQYTKEDAIIIMFMSMMGIDIVLLNPTGYVNIENVIDERIIPIFKLEKIEYDLLFSEKDCKREEKKSIIKRLFNLK